MRRIQYILKDSDYNDAWFDINHPGYIDILESKIIEKEGSKGKIIYKTTCLIRQKEIVLTPEEVVRQLYLLVLTQDYGYPKDRIQLEYPVSFGSDKRRSDIVIFDINQADKPYIFIEVNRNLQIAKEQLTSFCNATDAPIGVCLNGDQILCYHRKALNYFEQIPDIPNSIQNLSDVLIRRWTIKDLINNDILTSQKKSLMGLFVEIEQLLEKANKVFTNARIDIFEEITKLIFIKLYDELESSHNPKRFLEFRNYDEADTELKAKIEKLFERARNRWDGFFLSGDKIELNPLDLSICVATLEGVKLFNSNLDVVDEAFEYLINKTSKGDKGQYFTPRYVIDMCVKMLNPQEHEYIIDTAAGSCGFPVHTIFHVWNQIYDELGIPRSHQFTTDKKPARCEDYVKEKVFGIDFDERAVRVGRTLNLIAGDGQTNVLHLNTLDWGRWKERTDDDKDWIDTYNEGWKRLKKLRRDRDSNKAFNFDILMANPPFAGDIKETQLLGKYDLGKKVVFEKLKHTDLFVKKVFEGREPTFPEFLDVKGEEIIKMADGTYRKVKLQQSSTLGRDILFIERNLDFLKPGGRMAVVLPQGRFNNSSDKFLREYIADRCRILAVVGLHGNVFKPHTGTKTSVLLLQKWTDDAGINPRQDDYPIFFATMQEPSKDNSGDKIYLANEDGTPKLDEHGHLIVKHDLFNHDGLTQDGIAEAFIEFAKKEKLPFWLGKQEALSTK